MFVMGNPVHHYAWGSTQQLATFLGRPAPNKPEAELWMGAHDADPSLLPDDRRLNDVIAADPTELLGRRTAEAFGDRLPFLMKVLAVDAPLSLKVHPSAEHARRGHAREDAAGIALDAAERSYPDRSHKPELVFAVTRFEALAGFRQVDRTVELLHLLNVPWADQVAERLQDGPAAQVLRDVVTDTLAMTGRVLPRTLTQVGDAARRAGALAQREELKHRTEHRGAQRRIETEAVRVFQRVGELVQRYPTDPGSLVTLLLNNVVLAPGEAMYVSPGVVHSYVEGFGVEIMASSDNVLRAGLTPKHRDVDELLGVANFTPIAPPRWAPSERTADFVLLEPPVAEFCLTVGRPPMRQVPATGPRTLLVLEGQVEVIARDERIVVRQGQSLFISHADGPVDIIGTGRVAIGSVPT